MAGLAEMPAILRNDLALVHLRASHPAASLGTTIPVYGFCILHPDGPILVDTGVGFGNQFIDDLYEPKRAVLAELLDRFGIQVGQVAAVVNSHLHFDHCGQNPALHGGTIPFWVQSAEYETLRQDSTYTDANWALAPESQRRSVCGDERIAEGVTIIATPAGTQPATNLFLSNLGIAEWSSAPRSFGAPMSSRLRSPAQRTSTPTLNSRQLRSTRFGESRLSAQKSSTSATARLCSLRTRRTNEVGTP